MSVHIDTKNKKIVVEIEYDFQPQEDVTLIRDSILDLITQRKEDFNDTETIFWAIHLVKQLELNDEQLKRAFAEPTRVLEDLTALKKKHFETTEELRVLKETPPKEYWQKIPNLVKNDLIEIASNQ
ncbi:hypothetical protein [Polaribacter cellanae]|uniref:Uncharacterized protein n=1 Tax=Polaribacter cellanae TaxID=2818493 RepID=A0A975H6X7_9FLAO|nr:hypothetical protein [Polaribacter cellanae]QTE22394.1 hypothetical protein J3359_16575 [Polaribacter cellanae]